MQHNSIKESTSSNSTGGVFISLDELNNMSYLSGKQPENDKTEFSSTKQWTKSMKDIETEQKYYQQIITEIKNLEYKIDIIFKMLENNINNKPINKATEEAVTNNATWKDKLIGRVK